VAHQREHLEAQLFSQTPNVGLHLLVKGLHLRTQSHLRDVPLLDVVSDNRFVLSLNDQQAGAQLAQTAPQILQGLQQEMPPQGSYVHGGRHEGSVQDVDGVDALGGLQCSQQCWVVVQPEALPEEVDGAVQGIWLARVRPEECENLVRFTVMQGKLDKPDQLRGGFDRERGLTSW